jgi:hypothetical protein
MRKMNFKHMLAALISMILVCTSAAWVAAEKKEQFGETKGAKLSPEPATTPVKENICKNPKLCEAVEIDMLDQLQKSKVPLYLPPLKATSSTQAYQVALNLGLAVTDTLAAIINKDKAAVTKGAGIIYDYAQKLAIPEGVLGIYGAITQAIDKGEWDKLGTLIYEFKDGITTELTQKKRNGEAMLAVISGGLEGLFILAKSLDDKFTPESSGMLRNAEFVKFQDMNIKSLPEDLKTKEEVKAMRAALPKIDKIVNKPRAYTFKQTDVKALVNICEPLRKSLVGS